MTNSRSLLKSLKIQFRVIGALLMREVMTRYGRHNIGFLWLFVEPMLFTLGVTALWTATKATHGSSLPISAFALTGYSSILVWRNTVNRTTNAVTPNLSLMYHRNVHVIDVFASRIILEIVGAGTSFVVLTCAFIVLGWIEPPRNLLQVVFGWLMLAWFGASLSLLLGAISERSELIEKLWHPISYLLFPLSGAGFMVEWLPKRAQEVVLFLPMVHGVELLREGFFKVSDINAHYDLFYLISCNLCLTLFGFAIEREVSRKVEPE